MFIAKISFRLVCRGIPFILLALFFGGCEDMLKNSEDELEPLELIITKRPQSFLTEPDTLIFEILNEENVASIKLSVKEDFYNGKEYLVDIPVDQRSFIFDPKNYQSSEYVATLSLKDKNDKVVSDDFYFSLSNPSEDMLILPSFDNYNFDRLWILIEDTVGNMIHYQQIPVTPLRTYIKWPGNASRSTDCFNIHLIFEGKSTFESVFIKDAVIRSLYGFSGRDLSTTLYSHTSGYYYGKKAFTFTNIPEHTSFYLYRPYFYYDTDPYELSAPFECSLTSHHPGIYLVLENNEERSYYYDNDLQYGSSEINLDHCKPVTKMEKLTLPTGVDFVRVSSLINKKRFGADIELFRSGEDNIDFCQFAVPAEFDSIAYYETEVIANLSNGIIYEFTELGDIPSVIAIPNVDLEIIEDKREVHISTNSRYNYLSGEKLFDGSGMEVAWQFISKNPRVVLPTFPEALINQIPSLSILTEESCRNIFTKVGLNRYSHFVNYSEFTRSFDIFNFCPYNTNPHAMQLFARKEVYVDRVF